MLTRKQTELLLFINRRLAEDGVSPSFEEMKDALDLRSKSGIHRLITGLEERGFIRRLPHKARALEVLRLPESASRAPAAAPQGDNVVRLRAAQPRPVAPAPQSMAELPLLGRIAAGTPIEALADNSRTVPVPIALLGRGKNYALEIAGDSMTGDGILDGDTVVIEETPTAESGDIVVALVDREEATLKRFRRDGGRVVLEAANPAYPAQIYDSHRVQVQGRLIGLLRRY